MCFRTRFASLCNLMFPCFSFPEELSDEHVDQESPGIDSSVELFLPESDICKSWYRLVSELSNKSYGDKTSDSSLPSLLIRDVLLNLPVESISDVCIAWNELGHVSGSSRLSDFHNSVIHEILVKLPIKSIEQCKYVCKSWYKVISGPYFAKVYFSDDPKLASIAFSKHESIIRCPDDESFGFVEIGRNGNINRKPMNVKALVSPETTKAKKSVKILIGSCDGLLCFVEIPYEEDSYNVSCIVMDRLRGPNQIVWIVNPLIGDYMELPKVHGVDYDTVTYGFGSTVDRDHYKVLRIAMKNHYYVVGAQILTIGVDEKWRDLDISTFPRWLYTHGVILNGVLHWVGYWRHTSCNVIYAFDIGKETCRCFTISFEHYPFSSFLVVSDGQLCIIDNKVKVQVDLWTMKQYGVAESWKRDIILANNSCSGFFELIPVTTMRNGDLLLLRELDSSLMSFDPRTKKCVELEVSELVYTRFSMFDYTPSFVSLRGMISG